MKIDTPEELVDSINTIKNFCLKQEECVMCPLYDYNCFCLLDDEPYDWPDTQEIKINIMEF